jgi:hypothetical protein
MSERSQTEPTAAAALLSRRIAGMTDKTSDVITGVIARHGAQQILAAQMAGRRDRAVLQNAARVAGSPSLLPAAPSRTDR